MRTVNVVDAAQAHTQVYLYQRAIAMPNASQPRRVQAINSRTDAEGRQEVSTAPPDDGAELSLSPEARQAARQAEIDSRQGAASGEHTGNTEGTGTDQSSGTSQDEQAVRRLAERNQEVMNSVRARAAASGDVATSDVTYTYTVGPDGHLYATGGQVRIDTAPVPDDPEATIRKANQIARAATMPGGGSQEDGRAIAEATEMATEARQQLARKEETVREQQKSASGKTS